MSIENPEYKQYIQPEVKAEQMQLSLVFADENELQALKGLYDRGQTFRIVLTKDEACIGPLRMLHDEIAHRAGVNSGRWYACYYYTKDKTFDYKTSHLSGQISEMLNLKFRDLDKFSIILEKRIIAFLELNLKN